MPSLNLSKVAVRCTGFDALDGFALLSPPLRMLLPPDVPPPTPWTGDFPGLPENNPSSGRFAALLKPISSRFALSYA